ncbi:hypothetical protein COTS27_01312 [Spirochaetota bacterium]|nr:hypothetical protein COTS27_01312 [Spirochaetota bacterium]
MNSITLTLAELSTFVTAPDDLKQAVRSYAKDHRFLGLCTVEHPHKGHLVFIEQTEKLEKLLALKDRLSDLGGVLVEKKLSQQLSQQLSGLLPPHLPIIAIANAKELFINLLAYFNPYKEDYKKWLSSSQAKLKLGQRVHIAPYVTCGENVHCGDDVVMMGHNVIGSDVQIGSRVKLYPGVIIHAGTIIGDDTIIHAGSIIGSDGFGYHPTSKGLLKIPQIGHVVVGMKVEIGSNVTIDRGTLDATRLEDHVKIDNLVQIAHNVTIGAGTIIIAQAGIAGSSTLGRQVVLAGQVGVADHAVLEDGVQIGAQAGVMPNQVIPAGAKLVGSPCIPYKEFFRREALLRKRLLSK